MALMGSKVMDITVTGFGMISKMFFSCHLKELVKAFSNSIIEWSIIPNSKDHKMTLKKFFDWQTAGGTNDVMRLVDCLERADLEWCAIGGIAVNHWAAEPMVAQSVPADIHGILMRVASLEDTLHGKIKAWRGTEKRQSKKTQRPRRYCTAG
jgi:hypothetical protein